MATLLSPAAALLALTEDTPVLNKANRQIKSVASLGPVEGGTLQVQVSTSHSPESKKFYSTLTRQTASKDGVFQVVTFVVFEDTLSLLVQPVARYSVKALQAAHEDALDRVAFHFDQGAEAVTRLFAPKEAQ